jgi:hypothetical protein
MAVEFPIKEKCYLHGEKVGEMDAWQDMIEAGVPEDVIPRYFIYELECDIEIHENGDVFLTHVGGQKLPTPIRNT